MALNEIPLDTSPDQEFSITVDVGGTNIALILRLRYNTEGEFWHMDVTDANTGEMRLSNVPLLTGQPPAANLLKQFAHLGLGVAAVMPVTDDTLRDIPGLTDLGTDFVLVWGGADK